MKKKIQLAYNCEFERKEKESALFLLNNALNMTDRRKNTVQSILIHLCQEEELIEEKMEVKSHATITF